MKIQYAPVLFLPTNKNSEFKTLFGDNLEGRRFENIRDAKEFVKRYEDVQNFKIYGNDRFEYAFIADEHKGQIDWDMSHLSIAIVDIEVGGGAFANDPNKKIKIRKKT